MRQGPSSGQISLRFLGGVGTVTGSLHLVDLGSCTLLLECGLFQGPRRRAWEVNTTFSFSPPEIDLLLLSHAHLDHAGNIPTLVKQGFAGKIYATYATVDLASLMLADSAHLQAEDVSYLNRRQSLWGEAALKPLYTPEEVAAALPHFWAVPYQQEVRIEPGLSFAFLDAGHILGSALILLEVAWQDRKIRVCFTGDLGRPRLPILRDPYQVRDIDYLIMESTYGGSLHAPVEEAGQRLEEVISHAVAVGGKVIIPAFAVGRAQEILYELYQLETKQKIPVLPIYVDSPLTAEVTRIFKRHPECYDQETQQLFDRHEDPFGFKRLSYVHSVEESKALNRAPGPFLVLAASGMCEAGRILHHLIHGLPDPRNTILFVGYQAEGTLGRRLVEGARRVRILEGEYPVRARIEVMHHFSAHADRKDLLNYVAGCGSGIKGVFLVHGEREETRALAQGLREMGLPNVHLPALGQSYLIPEKAG